MIWMIIAGLYRSSNARIGTTFGRTSPDRPVSSASALGIAPPGSACLFLARPPSSGFQALTSLLGTPDFCLRLSLITATN